jgi:hypothetical protein
MSVFWSTSPQQIHNASGAVTGNIKESFGDTLEAGDVSELEDLAALTPELDPNPYAELKAAVEEHGTLALSYRVG